MRRVIQTIALTSLLGGAFFVGFAPDAILNLGRQPLAETRFQLELAPARLATQVEKLTRPSAAFAQKETELSAVDTYHRILETIQNEYANPPADAKAAKEWKEKLRFAGIDGMLASIGDRYTEYWTPEEYKRNMEDTSGHFYGVGARLDVTPDKKRVLIIEPIDGSPAFKGGVRAGDIITAVDGKSAALSATQRLDDVIKRIKGPEGTSVKLTIERDGKPKIYTFTRALVNSPVVESWMQDPVAKIGYIRLDMFIEDADNQFDIALKNLENQGMKALIFDLRGNPGGLLRVAQDLASRFIKEGPVVWIQQKNGQQDSLDVEPRKHRGPLSTGKIPVILLVNGGSASASEIVSGAIQDAGVGYLLGTRTFGKGLVQTIIPLAEGEGAVKITTQHYFTRDKHDINLKRDEDGTPLSGTGGIKPDYVVEEALKDIEAQRDLLRKNPRDRKGASAASPQIKRAVAILKDKLAGKAWPPSEKNRPDKEDKAAADASED